MSKDRNMEKGTCTDCGNECFKLCYVSKGCTDRLVCVDCFGKRCEKAAVSKQRIYVEPVDAG